MNWSDDPLVHAASCFSDTAQVLTSNVSSCCGCFRRTRSQSCPFCRDSLKRVNSGDLWIYTSSNEIIDLSSITKQNLKRLFMYIDKLPLIVPDPVFVPYEPCCRWGVLGSGACIKFWLVVYDSGFSPSGSTFYHCIYLFIFSTLRFTKLFI